MNRNFIILTSIYFLSTGYLGAGNITIQNVDLLLSSPRERMDLRITPLSGNQINMPIPQAGAAYQVIANLPTGDYQDISLYTWDPNTGGHEVTCSREHFRVKPTDTVVISLTNNPHPESGTGHAKCVFVNEAEFEKVNP